MTGKTGKPLQKAQERPEKVAHVAHSARHALKIDQSPTDIIKFSFLGLEESLALVERLSSRSVSVV